MGVASENDQPLRLRFQCRSDNVVMTCSTPTQPVLIELCRKPVTLLS